MRVILFTSLAALLASCGPEKTNACTDLTARLRAASQTCCPEFGAEACGTGLFCAAFDGRTEAVCYAERSRADGEQCSDSSQCVNGACNSEAGRCRFAPSAACDAVAGCSSDAQSNRYACDVRAAPPTCRLVGLSDANGTLCASPADCPSGACEASRCKLPLGGRCIDSAACVAGACVACADYGVTCQNYQNGAECLLDCGARLFRVRCD